MAQTATKLPVKTEGKAAPAPSLLPEWRPFESLRREIDQLFDNFHTGFWRTPSMPDTVRHADRQRTRGRFRGA